jgi:ankyrin repeat protein
MIMPERETPPEPSIHRAARLGDLTELARLMAGGADINSRADLEYDHGGFLKGLTPLMVAARSGDGASVETLRWMVERGADLRAVSRGGVTAAWYAAGDGQWLPFYPEAQVTDQLERLRYLLDAGLSPNEMADNGRSLLIEACRAGDPCRAALLIERGAAVIPNFDSDQARREEERKRETFRRAGVPEDQLDETLDMIGRQTRPDSFQIPVFAAAESGSAECVRLLLAAGADPNTRAQCELTPLMLAGSPEVVQVLVEAGADIHATDYHDRDALDVVLSDVPGSREIEEDQTGYSRKEASQNLAVAQALVEVGLDLHSVDEDGQDRLSLAAFSHRDQVVEWLLRRGLDPATRTNDGRTPLHAVSWNASPVESLEFPEAVTDRIVAMLVAAGADVNAADEDGNTPLHVATHQYSYDVSSDGPDPVAVRALLRHSSAEPRHFSAGRSTTA